MLIQLTTDAAFHPLHKDAAMAMVAKLAGQRIEKTAYYRQLSDNHQAEFMACRLALEYLNHHYPEGRILLYRTDSQILNDALNKAYVKNPRYQVELDKILPLLATYEEVFCQWVADKDNAACDHLAKQALRAQRPAESFI